MTTPSSDAPDKREKPTASEIADEIKIESRAPAADEVAASEDRTADIPASNGGEGVDEAPIPVQRAYGYWLLVMFVVFAGSLASLAWYGWNLFQTNATRINQVLTTQKADQTALDQALATAQSRLDRLDTETQAAQQQRAAMQSDNGATEKKLTQRIDTLDQHYAQIEDRLGRGELAWQVAEIGFLLTRAEERLSVSHDPAGAAVALTLADQRLAGLSRPEVLPVRADISQALAQLQQVDAFDRVGMALLLRRSFDAVPRWPLIGTDLSSRDANVSPPASTASQPDAAPWYVRWPRAVWQPVEAWLDRQFTLTRSDAPLKASARASTDRETEIWLTAVREALLARDPHALTASLQQAEDWIKSHYAEQDPEVKRTLQALEETQNFFATKKLPDLTPIFKAWRATGLMATTTSAPAATEAHP